MSSLSILQVEVRIIGFMEKIYDIPGNAYLPRVFPSAFFGRIG